MIRAAFRCAALAAAYLALGPSVFGQAPEVLESSGYVEVQLPTVGWRQAVVGRQLPAGSVVTAWRDARATIDYGGDTVTVGPLTHLKVQAVDGPRVQLALTEGSITVAAAAAEFEVVYRGIQVHVEKGAFSLVDGSLAVASGQVTVTEPGAKARTVAAGSRLQLLQRRSGPVFGSASR